MLDVALHNLRTPLSIAEGNVELLHDHADKLSAEHREQSLQSIRNAHARIRTLAEGALLENLEPPAEVSTEFTDVDVHRLVASMVDGLHDSAGEVALVGAVDPDAPATFSGDEHVVREALENLVTNAIKHSPPGKSVTITARGEGRSVRFDVTDRGPGIPATEQARLFGSPYRTQLSERVNLPGTGRGLSIVRRLVEGHGGTVGVSSRPGQGSTFWITFPLGDQA
jgi:signal transduction histidine kinase